MDLTKYIPDPEDLSMARVRSVKDRLRAYAAAWFPEIDTRPNSPFGDLYITPGAMITAAVEVAVEKALADVDLASLADGNVTDTAVAEAFLRNFSVGEFAGVSSTGVIKLVFSTNDTYALDAGTQFMFGASAFMLATDEGDPLLIYPTNTVNQRRVLIRESDARYVIYLPVVGPAGSQVADGSTAVPNLQQLNLVSVTATGSFDPGRAELSIAQKAERAQRIFPAAGLSSRSGVLSYLSTYFPSLIAASCTQTGDREMLRDITNVLGVGSGAIDVFVKGQRQYAYNEVTLTLAYDTAQRAYVGKLNLPHVPSFYSLASGAFQVGYRRTNRGLMEVYARSNHPVVDSVGVSYSRYEDLGLVLQQQINNSNIQQGVVNAPVQTVGAGVDLLVDGDYWGYMFNVEQRRNVSIRLDAVTEIDGVDYLQATVRDLSTMVTGKVYFKSDSDTNPVSATLEQSLGDYVQFFNGLGFKLLPTSGTYDPSAMLGFAYTLNYSAATADFQIGYLYDPTLVSVDAVINDPDNAPPGVSLWARSFIVSHINSLTVNYYVKSGRSVNTDMLKSLIVNYVNALAYPAAYDETQIGLLTLSAGASGVQSINKQAVIYPSLADYYVDKTGTVTNITKTMSATLIPPVNDFGFGRRNIAFILDENSIQLNAIPI